MSTQALKRQTQHSHPSSVDPSVDAALLDLLTGPAKPSAKAFARRDAALDPLLLAAAAASGPQVTRNHYHHDFFPGVMLPQAEGAWDWTKWTGENNGSSPSRLTYVSKQGPRRQRLDPDTGEENGLARSKPTDATLKTTKKRRPSLISPTSTSSSELKIRPKADHLSEVANHAGTVPPLEVKCMARTRIPTPHGPVFLHLYHNNRDNKEHLAIVVDSEQLSDHHTDPLAPPIRSRSLDAIWPDETEMDRIIRGAYVGRLSPSSQQPSIPVVDAKPTDMSGVHAPPPLIRIHSECFTGETVGSMRCDCGEQLDEAIRQISLPITIPTPSSPTSSRTIPGRGAVIYLRQEGRGIGLLSKIRAYNLQDLGHDTVTANLMLGHKADERGYEIAIAILRDLGLGDDSMGVRVLTNNPDKVAALEKDGLTVAERVPMVPRSWQNRRLAQGHNSVEEERLVGATMIGGSAVYGDDLDKYLRTKVLRMGHMLPLWLEDADVVGQ
ncbi:cyclohydrolase [Pluteus cervinus]|uniref:Cyclohydrolase n=1 Tax=Pluteus cervinus TaxID=181527 RepID=A0ACD3B2D9_9AGAR|nr:cyclohydrolase [Pluteus cervinus]